MDTGTLMAGMAFGAIGAGYAVYGKKQQNGVALFAGVALCIFPYMVTNIWAVIAIGLALMAVPFFVKW